MTLLPDALEPAIFARQGKREGKEIRFLCPVHDDHKASARWNPQKQVWHCDACGAGGGWKNLADRLGVNVPKKLAVTTVKTAASGLTLDQYANEKKLPIDFLRDLGLTEITHSNSPAVRSNTIRTSACRSCSVCARSIASRSLNR